MHGDPDGPFAPRPGRDGEHGEYAPPGSGPRRTRRGSASSRASGHGSGGPGTGGPNGTPGPDGRPPPGERRRRAHRRRTIGGLIGPLAGAVGLVILLGAGVYALADGRASCDGDHPIDLSVVAAPDIAPAVDDITRRFNEAKHTVTGRCVHATAHTVNPSTTATQLSGRGSTPGQVRPDVWIPDSSLWVTRVRSSPRGKSAVRATSTSLARSPIVVATSRDFATKIHDKGIEPTWDMLLKATDALAAGAVTKNRTLPADSIHLQILDPTRNAAGMGAVVMTHLLLQGDPHATPIFTQIVRSVQSSVSPNTKALFATFDRGTRDRAPMIIASEQSVWKYDKGTPATPVSALYPAEGMLNLDYPFTVTTEDDTKARAARLLEKTMSDQSARAAVRSLGFRSPDGRAGGDFDAVDGVDPSIPRALPTPKARTVTQVMRAWTKLTLGTRMLTLLDVSGSMAQKIPGSTTTRLQALAKVAQEGLALYPDSTEIGQWLFSTGLDGNKDYRKTVPIGPLDERTGSTTRRQHILGVLGRVRPEPDGDTGLYDSLLAAYKVVKRGFEPDKYNFVIVFTDGENDDAHGISLDRLLKDLKELYEPDRPVSIVSIGFGPDTDPAAMQKIAAATNGQSFVAERPEDVRKIFLQVVSRRVCRPDCPKD